MAGTVKTRSHMYMDWLFFAACGRLDIAVWTSKIFPSIYFNCIVVFINMVDPKLEATLQDRLL